MRPFQTENQAGAIAWHSPRSNHTAEKEKKRSHCWERAHIGIPSDTCWHFLSLLCLFRECPFTANKYFLFNSFPISGCKLVVEVTISVTNWYQALPSLKLPSPCWTSKATSVTTGLAFHLISPLAFVLNFHLYCSGKVKTPRDNSFYLQLCHVEYFWQFHS